MGKIKIILLVSVLLYTELIFSNNKQKPNIDSLVNVSDAVVLGEYYTVNIQDEDKAEFTYQNKILIKNSKADDYCKVVLTETEFQNIDDIHAAIYDTTGKIIKELDDDDIKSAEITPGYSYYSSEKYKWFSLITNKYPFILEYSYKVKISSLFFWPDWDPQFSIPNLSGSYTLNINKNIKFNYYQKGPEIKLLKKTNGDDTTYIWSVKDLPGRIKEDFMPPEDAAQNVVYFSPERFKVRDYAGKFESWASLGNWYKKLSEGRYKLPPKAIDELKTMLANTTDTKEKLEKIYKYLQQNNRYVAIELGIAGWQPQPASEVYQNHYGDCKDLTTYMVAMLRACGIKSYPALALMRDDGIVNKNFPSNQFNHSIAFVPLNNDTLWLECTGQYLDIGDMPYNIQGINALVVTDNNAELVRTPIKEPDSNKWCSKISGNLTPTGNLVFNADLLTTGDQKNYFKSNFGYKNNEEDLEFLKKNFSKYYSGLNIQRYSLDDSDISKFDIKVIGVYNNFMNPSGSYVFINPNILNRRSPDSLPNEEPEKRIFPVFNNFPYLDVDTVEITLPSTYSMRSKPMDKIIDKDFGSYSLQYRMQGNNLIYVRRFELKEREIPLESYKDYKEFLDQVINMDKSPIVFKRSTP